MRAKVLKLNELNFNKHFGKVESVGFVIPHFAYTSPLERNFTSQIGFLLKSFVFKAMIKRGKIEDFAGQTFKEIFV